MSHHRFGRRRGLFRATAVESATCMTTLPLRVILTHVLHDLQGWEHHVDTEVLLPLALCGGIGSASSIRDRVAVIEVIQCIAYFLGLLHQHPAAAPRYRLRSRKFLDGILKVPRIFLVPELHLAQVSLLRGCVVLVEGLQSDCQIREPILAAELLCIQSFDSPPYGIVLLETAFRTACLELRG